MHISILLQEFWRNLKALYHHMLINGFWSTWSQLVDSLDPFGEKNALKALELEAGASQEEIRSRYRELTKQFHPDKVQGNQQEKEAAHEKFVLIQQVIIFTTISFDLYLSNPRHMKN